MNEPELPPPPAPEPTVHAASSGAAAPAPATPTDAQGPADGAAVGGATDGAPGDGERRRRRRRRRRRGQGGGEGVAAEGADGPVGTNGADGPDTPAGGEPGGDATAPAAEGGAPTPLPRPQRQPRPQQQQQQRQQQQGKPRHEHRNERRPERGARPHGGQHGGGHGHAHGRDGRRDSEHSAMAAVKALADMAHALLKVEGVDPLSMPRYLELNLRVPLDGGNDIRHAAGTAVEQISQRVREVREHEKALRPGAVFSYFAGSAHAEGCRPTEPRQVFDGYSSTGKPVFSDFVTMAIERKDPHIEQLLAGEEIVLTRVSMGRVLRTQQLAEFGGNSPVFKILGQVDAGLFRTLGAAGRCAYSFQLLRGTTLEGRVRLRLHWVGAVDPMDLADPALLQILSRFQRHLDVEAMRLQGQLQHGEVDEEAFVLPMLQEFAQRLQSRTRNTGRRTQHGLERSEAGQRPTSRAYPDAGEASDDAILWDVDQGTVVVVGQKGRVHVFSPQGKHVTSVTMQGHAIERRRHMGRWRLAEPEERGEFRICIKKLIASGDTSTQEEGLPGEAGKPHA